MIKAPAYLNIHKLKSMEVNAIIYVNRESQKGIVIGESGSMLKTIGTAARKNLESFFEKKVRLNLWFKLTEWEDFFCCFINHFFWSCIYFCYN